MRTTIDIDPELLAEAIALSGLRTKKATLEEALRALIRSHRRRTALTKLEGLGWEGNLDEMRTDRRL